MNNVCQVRSEAPQNSRTNWLRIVDQVRNNDPEGIAALYEKLFRGLKFFLQRRLGPGDYPDDTQEIILNVVQAIRRGEIRDAAAIPGFTRTIANRQAHGHIKKKVRDRSLSVPIRDGFDSPCERPNPEAQLALEERTHAVRQVLARLCATDRDVLTRYFLNEQPVEDICRELNITQAKFRTIKTLAIKKLRCCEPAIQRNAPTQAIKASIFICKVPFEKAEVATGIIGTELNIDL